MPTRLESCIVRVYRKDEDIPVGAGSLVGDRRIVTCAHVVALSFGLAPDARERPDGEVRLDLPFVAPGKILTARIVFWLAREDNGSGDIAGLELTDPPPEGASPAQLLCVEDLWRQRFRAIGFPAENPDGLSCEGKALGRQAAGLVEIRDLDEIGYFVKPGFSGTPAWSRRANGVVLGMVAAADPREDKRTGWMIPAAELTAAWPELSHAVVRLPPGRLSNVPALPEHYLARPEYLEPLKEKLLGGADRKLAVTGKGIVGVQGMGGIGKSVLAAAVAREGDVRRAFPDGVAWLTLGQTPSVLARQAQPTAPFLVATPAPKAWQGETGHDTPASHPQSCGILGSVWAER